MPCGWPATRSTRRSFPTGRARRKTRPSRISPSARLRARSRPAPRAAPIAFANTTSCYASRKSSAPRPPSPAARRSERSHNDHTRSASPRRKHLEQGKPVYRLDRRGFVRTGPRRSQSRWTTAEGRRLHVRPGVHVSAQARHPNARDRARPTRSAVDTRDEGLASQRTALRRAAGAEQSRDRRQARRRADQNLAAQLRHPAAAADDGRRAASVARSALSRARLEAAALDGVAQGHGRTVSAVLARGRRAGKRVIIAAHGNSLRALVKYLDNVSEADIVELNIPTGIPLVYELEDDLTPIRHYYLGDPAAAAAAAARVAAQTSQK